MLPNKDSFNYTKKISIFQEQKRRLMPPSQQRKRLDGSSLFGKIVEVVLVHEHRARFGAVEGADDTGLF